MEFKYYSVDFKIEGKELKVMGTLIDYKVVACVGTFVNGELIEPVRSVVSTKELNECIKWATGKGKNNEFLIKLAEKIQNELNQELNK